MKITSLLTLGCFLIFQGAMSQNLLKNSAEFIHPFSSISSPKISSYLEEELKGNRLLGLGEVSHYTKECYEIKGQIIQDLMKKGYGGLILEVDFGQALLWNEYVLHGTGNLDSLVAGSGWFTYRTEEFKEILQGIRTFNEQTDQSFQVFGMEMTAQNHSLEWLQKYVGKSELAPAQLLSMLKEERKIVAFQAHTREERLSYWNLFFEVSNFLEENGETLIGKLGEQNFRIANHVTELLRQYATYISQDDFSLKSEFRDQFSARNVLWSLETLGEESKAIIWAHNGHIAKESILFNYDILGHYLQNWFGDAYYSVGFSFNEGEFGAFSANGFKRFKLAPMDTASLTLDFHAQGSPYLIFNIRKHLVNNPSSKHFLKSEQLLRRDISESFQEGGATQMRINLSRTYDALIYIEKTSFPRTIDWIR